MENQNPGPDHFRYVDTIGPEGLTVTLQKWVAYAETDKCWYLASESDYRELVKGHQYGWTASSLKRRRKRVLKHQYLASRCFAYPDKERALNSYKMRKQWQIRHATLALERAKAAIGYFGDSSVDVTETPDCAVIPSEYIQELGWGDY
ncbi:hypothetical protein [Pseudomonas sp. 6D_7.1_Bac1]|uniref:hypothetical protein n=1 Tax=Pseudomonas sp. 6D_7.1_Bac1 TaxID=2971615 RepID=UPI0021C75E4D|nr:hypothetical protein [Pseudomonas sp. 6D_7.1_Bac1]MCU1752197.1 hypothetical protein [Pseudomonas sp. 6D_7.1_Bac1]